MGKKSKIVLQEKYGKGNVINKTEVLRLVKENIEKITIELRERTLYDDKTEGLLIEIRY